MARAIVFLALVFAAARVEAAACIGICIDKAEVAFDQATLKNDAALFATIAKLEAKLVIPGIHGLPSDHDAFIAAADIAIAKWSAANARAEASLARKIGGAAAELYAAGELPVSESVAGGYLTAIGSPLGF